MDKEKQDVTIYPEIDSKAWINLQKRMINEVIEIEDRLQVLGSNGSSSISLRANFPRRYGKTRILSEIALHFLENGSNKHVAYIYNGCDSVPFHIPNGFKDYIVQSDFKVCSGQKTLQFEGNTLRIIPIRDIETMIELKNLDVNMMLFDNIRPDNCKVVQSILKTPGKMSISMFTMLDEDTLKHGLKWF